MRAALSVALILLVHSVLRLGTTRICGRRLLRHGRSAYVRAGDATSTCETACSNRSVVACESDRSRCDVAIGTTLAPRSNGEPSVRLGDVGVEHHGPLQHIPQQVRACADYRGCRQGFDFRNRAFLRSPFCWIRTIRLGPSEPKGDGGRCATSDLGPGLCSCAFHGGGFRRFCVDVVLEPSATCVDRDCGQARVDGCCRKGVGAGFVQSPLREFLRQADAIWSSVLDAWAKCALRW